MALLQPGTSAPAIPLPLQDGREINFVDLRGKHVVLYFYPMDNTPGCRVEAQGFRDAKPQLDSADAIVLGVSRQKAASHQSFIDKEGLNFDLVVDAKGDVARAFGVGTLGPLTARRTFLIGPDGAIRRVWSSVTPAKHAAEVLEAIETSRSQQ